MGKKTSVVAQLDFLLPTLVKKCHRPTKLTGRHNVQAHKSLRAQGLVGITASELATERGWCLSSAGSSLVELRWLGLARKTEVTRNNKPVYLIKDIV